MATPQILLYFPARPGDISLRGRWYDLTHYAAGAHRAARTLGATERHGLATKLGVITRTVGQNLASPEYSSVTLGFRNNPLAPSMANNKGFFGNPADMEIFEGLELDSKVFVFILAPYDRYRNLRMVSPFHANSYQPTYFLYSPNVVGETNSLRMVPRFVGLLDFTTLAYVELIHELDATATLIDGVAVNVLGIEKIADLSSAAACIDPLTGVDYDNIEVVNDTDLEPPGYIPGQTDNTRYANEEDILHDTLVPKLMEELIKQTSTLLREPVSAGPFPQHYKIEINTPNLVGLHFQILPDAAFYAAIPALLSFAAFYVLRNGQSYMLPRIDYADPPTLDGFTQAHTATGWTVAHTGHDGVAIDSTPERFGTKRYLFCNAGWTSIEAALTGVPAVPPTILPCGWPEYFTSGPDTHIKLHATYSWHPTNRYCYVITRNVSNDDTCLWRQTWDGSTWGAGTLIASAIAGDMPSNEEGYRAFCFVHDRSAGNIIEIRNLSPAGTGTSSFLIYRLNPATGASIGTCISVEIMGVEFNGSRFSQHIDAIDTIIQETADGRFHFVHAPNGVGWTALNARWNYKPRTYDSSTGEWKEYNFLPLSFVYAATLGGTSNVISCLVRDGERVYLWHCPVNQPYGTWWNIQDELATINLVTEDYEDGQAYALDYSPENMDTAWNGCLLGFVHDVPFRLGPQSGFVIRRHDSSKGLAWSLNECAKHVMASWWGALEIWTDGQLAIVWHFRQHTWPDAETLSLDGDIPTLPTGFNLLTGKTGDLAWLPFNEWVSSGVEVKGANATERAEDLAGNEDGNYDFGARVFSLDIPLAWSRTQLKAIANIYRTAYKKGRGAKVRLRLSMMELLARVSLSGITMRPVEILEDIVGETLEVKLVEIQAPLELNTPADSVWTIATALVVSYGLQGIQDEMETYGPPLPCWASCSDPWYQLLIALAQQSETGPWDRNQFSILLAALTSCILTNCPGSIGGNPLPDEIS